MTHQVLNIPHTIHMEGHPHDRLAQHAIENPISKPSTITREKIARLISKNLRINISDAYNYIDIIIAVIVENLLDGRDVELEQLGVFCIKTRAARLGRNPKSPKDEKIISAHKVISLRAAKELIKRINNTNIR